MRYTENPARKSLRVLAAVFLILVAVLTLPRIPEVMAQPPELGDYVVVESAGSLDRITPGGVKTVIVGGLGFPTSVAIDSFGNYIVAEIIGGAVDRITTAGVEIVVTNGLSDPESVAIVPPPVLVGGTVIPVDMLALLKLWLGLVAVLGVAGVLGTLAARRMEK